MKHRHLLHIIPFTAVILSMIVVGCSTQKNTSQSRWWHSFNARYNTYYNGTLAYIDGALEKETGNKDNYTEMIPLYTVSNKNSKELGKANFERAITKCEKAIQQHSIKRRPEWNKSRRKTEKDIEWLSRKEYNPFLWKAWLLMGRSQFQKGDFEGAASTFSYMSRLYATQPAIYGRARAWLAKCYIEQDWTYDAEDVIRNMKRDSIHWRAQKEWDYTLADYYIHTGDFTQAIPYLRKVISHEMRRKQKAREWYLMGQLQAAIQNREQAYKAFKHCISLNPPYELEFNARIAMTEVLAKNNAKKMISRLKRMAISDKNAEYLDQVYYAIGNIYLAEKDTAKAISAYEKGNVKATRSGIEKGVLLLHLGDLYWGMEKFSDARRCYGEAIGLLDKDRKDYQQLSDRSKVLDELVPFTESVHLQDSLQQLAKMNEKDRNAAIDRVITALKKKEKEERNKKAEEESARQQAQNGGNNMVNKNNTNNKNNNTQSSTQNGQWYFYNPIAVSQGKTQFQRLWGKRENIDNWQRINKTVVANSQGAEEMTDEVRDSLAQVAQQEDSLKQITDSAQNDPHKREYYLAQIPFTEEQIEASNKVLEDALYHSGVIFKDQLDNLPLSEKALRRLEDNYPDYEHMDDNYYHLYLLYSRKNMPDTAETYIGKLKDKYPDSQWTTLLTDPYFKENAKFGVHIEDSLYAATYEAFKASRYNEVKGNSTISEKRFPMGANRDKFLFIGGLSKLNDGDTKGCIEDMKTVVEKYPDSRLSEMAGMIVNGVNEGRRLYGGKFDLGDVWNRRTTVLNDNDSTSAKKFTSDRNTDFTFLFVYNPDSVNENQLIFEMAKFNFTRYLVRNFDMNIEDQEGLHQMIFSGFRNFDEAWQYAHAVSQQTAVTKLLYKARAIIISQSNLKLLGKQYTYNEYEKYYNQHFSPLKINTSRLLTEPTEIVIDKNSKAPQDEEPTLEEDVNNRLDNGFTIEEPEDNKASSETETTVIEDTPAASSNESTTIQEESNKVKTDLNTETEFKDEEETTIIQETPKEEVRPKENVQTETEILPEIRPEEKAPEKATPKVEENKKPAVIETEVSKKPAVKKEENIVKPAEKEVVSPAPQPTEDTGIIFDDDVEDNTPSTNKSNKKKEENNFDLEDEYYDLDGF